MQGLRVGSHNKNNGRDKYKRALVTEVVKQKKIEVVFLQETHSDITNEISWGLWFEELYTLKLQVGGSSATN